MASSIDALAKYLRCPYYSNFPIFKSLGLPEILLGDKGVYPYDYMNSIERFNKLNSYHNQHLDEN